MADVLLDDNIPAIFVIVLPGKLIVIEGFGKEMFLLYTNVRGSTHVEGKLMCISTL